MPPTFDRDICLFLAYVNVNRRALRWLLALMVALGVLVVLATPIWLPWLGAVLVVDDGLQPGDVALVLEGTGSDATDVAEAWRQQGLVHAVVIVEAPVKTHALVAYWSDFVRWGLAAPAATPAVYLQVVRAPSTQAAEQARAALPALQADSVRQVLVVGGGGIGSRLVKRLLLSVLAPAGMDVRMVAYAGAMQNPGRWYQDAMERRAVLDSWLQLLVPYLSGYESGAGS
jgi:hypothetical protein